MTESASRYSKQSLILLGSFAIGYNVSNAIHELGHAIAMWLSGGRVNKIYLHPFSWCYTFFGDSPSYPITTTAAGVIFSTLVSLLVLALVWRRRNAWLFPFVVIGLCTLIVNAIYLGVDAILLSGGDGTWLVGHGVSRPLVITIGCLLLFLGFVIAMLLLPRLGFKQDDGIWTRLKVLWTGVGTYLLVMLAYHLLFNRREILLWSVYVVVGFVLVSLWGVSSPFVESRFSWVRSQRTDDINWISATVAFSVGTAIVATELVINTNWIKIF